jgi:[protein-PII] uridylyltransferase
MPELPRCDTFQTMRQTYAETFLKHGRARLYLSRHSALLDRTVREMAKACALPASCALAAVGGYGRAEMFPHSDIDVLVLMPQDHSEEDDACIERFVTELWNLGLNVGSGVRTPAEMLAIAKEDITAATAFLEARYLAGDRELFETTYKAFIKRLDARQFFSRKMLEMRQRHQRFADTPYALEPNLKESPGGLRDLQVFLWCAKVAGYGSSWNELAGSGLITQVEAYHLSECQNFLFDLRIRLHLLTGRHEDRLLFDTQTPLAKGTGYKKTAGLIESEALMKRYYINAKHVVQLRTILIQSISERLLGIADDSAPVRKIDDLFIARGDALDILDDTAFRNDPQAALRLFFVYAQHKELKLISSHLLRALWHARYRLPASFRTSPENKRLFVDILQQHYGTYHCLKNMNIWGILGRFLPVFRRIVGQMQHDLFHAYTVDQHTIMVVKYLRRFCHSAYAHEFPLCTQVMSEVPENWRLTLAGLFHDIAKGRGGDHCELGCKEVLEFCRSFGIGKDTAEYCAFLVRWHIEMSRVAQKEDTSDPEVIRRFAEFVGTKERLDGLFLLTCADIRATSPKVWNAWKQQLLENLYTNTLEVLRAKGGIPDGDTLFALRRKRTLQLVDEAGVPAEVRDAFWSNFDIAYFLRHTPEDIAWHTASLASSASSSAPVVRCRAARNNVGLEVLVYLPDQKDLFARVVSYFEREGLSVLDARIYTTMNGWALDTFLVQVSQEQMDDLAELAGRVQTRLTRQLEQQKPLPKPRTGRLSRRSRIFPTTPLVDIELDQSKKRWMLQIICNDRIGLLFSIATVLAKYGINLETAKISTMDERVEDTFLVSGPALASEEQVVALENDLLAVIRDAR